jgi:hypothetical protein
MSVGMPSAAVRISRHLRITITLIMRAESSDAVSPRTTVAVAGRVPQQDCKHEIKGHRRYNIHIDSGDRLSRAVENELVLAAKQ